MSQPAVCNTSQSTNASEEAQQLLLEYSSPENAALAQKLLEERSGSVECLASPINNVVIKGKASLVNFTAFEGFIRQCPEQVTDLHWELDKPINRALLDTIEQTQPELRLHYDINFSYKAQIDSYWPPDPDDSEDEDLEGREEDRRAILGSKNLYSVKRDIAYGGESNYQDLPFTYDLLTTCPNVRELDLSIAWAGGCCISENPYAFDFSKDERRFGPLEVLKLTGYDLRSDTKGERVSVDAPVHIRDFTSGPLAWLPESVIGYLYYVCQDFSYTIPFFDDSAYHEMQIASMKQQKDLQEPDNLNEWMKRMDFSNVKTLKLTGINVRVLERFASVLQSVDHLTLSGCEIATGQYLPAFLRNISRPLVSVNIALNRCNYTDVVLALNETSSGSLKSFESSGYLGASALLDLSMGCPEIENLTISIARVDLNSDNQQSSDNKEQKGVVNTDRRDLEARGKHQPDLHLDFKAIFSGAMIPKLQNLTIRTRSPDDEINELQGLNRWSRGRSHLSRDPDLNRSSVPAFFEEINDRRLKAGFEVLRQLEITTGPWYHGGDWGMGGAPFILVSKWCCETLQDGSTRCHGGNKRLGYYSGEVHDVFSEDWSRPSEVQYGDHEYSLYELQDLRGILE